MTTMQALNALSPVAGDGTQGSPEAAAARMADSIHTALVKLFPGATPGAVRELVNTQLARFRDAKVTTFIPILVTRACREALAAA